MLLDFDHAGKLITAVPFQSEFQQWKSRMTAPDKAAIKLAIHQILDSGEVHTTSWIPGPNWGGTPFDPIYSDGTKRGSGRRCQVLWPVRLGMCPRTGARGLGIGAL